MSEFQPTCNGGAVRSYAMSSDGGSNVDDDYGYFATGKGAYKRHEWILVHHWRNITLDEALLKAEKVMTDEFNIARGLKFQEWPEPKLSKIWSIMMGQKINMKNSCSFVEIGCLCLFYWILIFFLYVWFFSHTMPSTCNVQHMNTDVHCFGRVLAIVCAFGN